MQRKTEAYIHIKARLWNATLVSDYPRVDVVNIVSYAAFTNTYGIQQERRDDWASVRFFSDTIYAIPILIRLLWQHIFHTNNSTGRNSGLSRTAGSSRRWQHTNLDNHCRDNWRPSIISLIHILSVATWIFQATKTGSNA